MSTSTSASAMKRSRSPNAEVSPLPEPKSQITPSARDRTSKASVMPPVGMFSTKSCVSASRRYAPTSSPSKQQPQKLSRLTSSRQATPGAAQPEAADQTHRRRLKAPTVSLEKPHQGQHLLLSSSLAASHSTLATTAIQPLARLATTASTVAPLPATPEIVGAKDCNDVKDQGQDAITELNIAILLETIQGTGNGSSIIGSITAAQSSLAQLTSTYQRVLTAPINPDHCDQIIQALEGLKKGSVSKLATTKAPLTQSPARPSNPTQRISGTTTKTQTKLEMLPYITAAHDEGFKAGISAAREDSPAAMKTRVQEAHDRGFKAGVETAKKASGTNQEDAVTLGVEANKQFEQCKEWLRDIVRARDRGEKAQIGALISKAEMAEWLEHEPEDGFEDQIMVG